MKSTVSNFEIFTHFRLKNALLQNFVRLGPSAPGFPSRMDPYYSSALQGKRLLESLFGLARQKASRVSPAVARLTVYRRLQVIQNTCAWGPRVARNFS